MKNKQVGKNSSQVHKHPQRSKRKRFVPFSKKAKLIAMSVVIISMIIVLTSIILNVCFSPDKVAVRTLENMARDYYENYYYNKFIDENNKESLEEFKESGLAPVYLRHLLAFDNERNEKYAGFFDNSSYVCDKNATFIKIIPVEPYTKKDYNISYTLTCNYK